MSLINSKLVTPNDVIIESVGDISTNTDEVLEESFIGDLGKSILKGSAAAIGIITASSLFSVLQANISFDIKKRKMTKLSDYKKLLSKVSETLDKVKFIKYKEGVPEVLSNILKNTDDIYKKLAKLDAELQSIKTYEELKEKENELKESYKALRDEYTKNLYEEYKNISDNWIDGNIAIVKQLKAFTTIDYAAYNRYDMEDGKLKNSFPILRTDEEHAKEIESIIYSILGIFDEVPTSFKEVKDILSCIKVQFKGDTINDIEDKKIIKESIEDITSIEESINDIEREISISELNEFDDLIECIVTMDSLLESVTIMTNNNITKLHSMQYDVLSECVESDRVERMNILYESTIGDMWRKFIAMVSAAIEKLKNKISIMVFSAVAGFDIYGKWADSFEKKLDHKKSTAHRSSTNVTFDMHNWNISDIFTPTQFNDIGNFASIILGKATTKDDMKKKLNDFYGKSWTNDDIYKFIMEKYYPKASIGGGSKASIQNDIIESIMNDKSTISIDENKVKSYLKILKDVKSNVTTFAGKSKIKMLNPEFDTLVKECKKASNEFNNEEANPVEFRYYRERYNVLSIVQQATFDIYYIKIKLVKAYVKELQSACNAYISSTINESVDYLSMQHDAIKGAGILTEA